MISKDQAIIMQVAAKIAAELTVKSENVEATCSDWEMAFNYVNDKLQQMNGMELIKEAFPSAQQDYYQAEQQEFTQTRTSSTSPAPAPVARISAVKVAGTQHGDLPNWLIAACQKAGVTKVWDNRDKAVGTKRPWFKQADAVDGQEPAAFWPPKGA